MENLLYIDLFCGAGGTSTGVERARLDGDKCARVIACVNHDKNAIASHAANHPDALHYTEDIRTLDLSGLAAHTAKERTKNPGALLVLWASLECTNFSKAKGGQPRDADSRTLAEHLFRYIERLQPDYIYIENVEEFMCWGDLDQNGKPISRYEGRLYLRWVDNVCAYGYRFAHRLLNAADYGARTSRTRFFGIFAKSGLPIVFPEPTHCKGGRKADMFHPALQPWNAVRDCLELDNEGQSIFTRRKPLTERTLERIYSGLVKFVAGGKEAFIVKYNSWSRAGHYSAPGIDEPCPVVAAQNRLGVAKVQFLSKQFSGDPDSKNVSIENPSGTITCKDHHALVSSSFIDAYYGKGHEHSIDTPSPVVRTVGHLALVTSCFMDMQYGNGKPADIGDPSPTVTAVPKMKLVSVKRGQFLMNPAYQSKGGSIDKPSFTLVARMDKTPPYLITTQKGDMAVVIYNDDTPAMRKTKEFMAIYGIIDIKMRMLNISELKRIMGFGADYVLIGTQTEQKKYIGNAVEVNMAKVLCEALAKELKDIAKTRKCC
ncbi:MAG: DNA cytosine methyltransferase [Bacteroidales bacterium]|nr:DNA cytosine methyltransferase [Bacteroidales bacterium]